MQLMMTISFKQPQKMWLNQLEHDKDIVAQLEAIRYLAHYKNITKDAMTVLYRVLSNNDIFYRGMIEAASCLGLSCFFSISSHY
jgi:hypothetical protein